MSSAYTLVKDQARTQFVYRDSLWHGADMFGTGVASFGHVSGVHVQNVDRWEDYVGMLDRGELPLGRALPVDAAAAADPRDDPATEDRPAGRGYFRDKFGVDILERVRGRLRPAGGRRLPDA